MKSKNRKVFILILSMLITAWCLFGINRGYCAKAEVAPLNLVLSPDLLFQWDWTRGDNFPTKQIVGFRPGALEFMKKIKELFPTAHLILGPQQSDISRPRDRDLKLWLGDIESVQSFFNGGIFWKATTIPPREQGRSPWILTRPRHILRSWIQEQIEDSSSTIVGLQAANSLLRTQYADLRRTNQRGVLTDATFEQHAQIQRELVAEMEAQSRTFDQLSWADIEELFRTFQNGRYSHILRDAALEYEPLSPRFPGIRVPANQQGDFQETSFHRLDLSRTAWELEQTLIIGATYAVRGQEAHWLTGISNRYNSESDKFISFNLLLSTMTQIADLMGHQDKTLEQAMIEVHEDRSAIRDYNPSNCEQNLKRKRKVPGF